MEIKTQTVLTDMDGIEVVEDVTNRVIIVKIIQASKQFPVIVCQCFLFALQRQGGRRKLQCGASIPVRRLTYLYICEEKVVIDALHAVVRRSTICTYVTADAAVKMIEQSTKYWHKQLAHIIIL